MTWRPSSFIIRRLIDRQVSQIVKIPQVRAVSSRVSCAQLLNSTAHKGATQTTYSDKVITIYGRVQSIRKQKKTAFAHITDGSTLNPLQAILSPEQAAELTTGTIVLIEGSWTPSPGKGQDHELKATHLEITGPLDDPATYPIQKKQHSVEFLRSIPHLRIRTPFNSLLTRFRSECIFLLTQFFRTNPNHGPFTQVQPPVITSSDCEGAGQVFTVVPRDFTSPANGGAYSPGKLEERGGHFFRNPAYLTVSTQLHLEAYAAALGSVWTLSPTFRAERSDTGRHLAEFYMLEAEVQHITSLSNILDLVEAMIRSLVSDLRATQAGQEILSHGSETLGLSGTLSQRWSDLVRSSRWPRITYSVALELLQKKAKESSVGSTALLTSPPTWDLGLTLEHEKWLVENVGLGSPIFVTDYPKTQKPFYMAPSVLGDNGDGEKGQAPRESEDTVACFDLLLPSGVAEVAGGSLREWRTRKLLANMRRAGMIDLKDSAPGESSPPPSSTASNSPSLHPHEPLTDNHPLKWYIDLRRHGGSPHGGFGLGFDRLVAFLAGVENVRDVVGFPRTWRRADC